MALRHSQETAVLTSQCVCQICTSSTPVLQQNSTVRNSHIVMLPGFLLYWHGTPAPQGDAPYTAFDGHALLTPDYEHQQGTIVKSYDTKY